MTNGQANQEMVELVERTWAAFVNADDDRYFGNRTQREKQLAALHRLVEKVTLPLLKQQEEMREALQKCRDQFDFYVSAHMAKQPPDMDKAARNQEFVELCDDVLASLTKPALEDKSQPEQQGGGLA